MIWRELCHLFTGRAAHEAPTWAPYQRLATLPDQQAKVALMRTGLCHGRDNDAAFVHDAIGGFEFARGIDLRRHGTRLDADALRAIGRRANTVLTAEYLEILIPAGLANPIEAADILASAY